MKTIMDHLLENGNSLANGLEEGLRKDLGTWSGTDLSRLRQGVI